MPSASRADRKSAPAPPTIVRKRETRGSSARPRRDERRAADDDWHGGNHDHAARRPPPPRTQSSGACSGQGGLAGRRPPPSASRWRSAPGTGTSATSCTSSPPARTPRSGTWTSRRSPRCSRTSTRCSPGTRWSACARCPRSGCAALVLLTAVDGAGSSAPAARGQLLAAIATACCAEYLGAMHELTTTVPDFVCWAVAAVARHPAAHQRRPALVAGHRRDRGHRDEREVEHRVPRRGAAARLRRARAAARPLLRSRYLASARCSSRRSPRPTSSGRRRTAGRTWRSSSALQGDAWQNRVAVLAGPGALHVDPARPAVVARHPLGAARRPVLRGRASPRCS